MSVANKDISIGVKVGFYFILCVISWAFIAGTYLLLRWINLFGELSVLLSTIIMALTVAQILVWIIDCIESN